MSAISDCEKTPAAFKNSGIDWLGQIPAHWDVLPLRRVTLRVATGRTPPSTNTDYFTDGELNWFTPGDFSTGIELHESARKVTPEAIEDGVCTLFPKGTVFLVGIGATLGKVAVSTSTGSANQQINAILPNEHNDPYFIAYFLHGFKAEVRVTSNGNTLGILNQDGTKSLQMPVPPLDTQRRIARFLDEKTARIDGLIEKKRALLDRLAEKRQALITRAVTKGLNPNAPMKPSGIDWLGDIPAHWVTAALGYRYEIQLGRMLNAERASGENLKPYLRVFDVQWGGINTDNLPLMDFPPEAQLRYRLEPGDLLVNEGGSYVGRSAIWRGQLDECYYQKALHRIRAFDLKKDTAEFLCFVMEAATTNMVFVAGGNQTTIDHLTAEQLRHYRFAFPPMVEQLDIADDLYKKLDDADCVGRRISESITGLYEYRSALITAAVTGHGQLADLR